MRLARELAIVISLSLARISLPVSVASAASAVPQQDSSISTSAIIENKQSKRRPDSSTSQTLPISPALSQTTSGTPAAAPIKTESPRPPTATPSKPKGSVQKDVHAVSAKRNINRRRRLRTASSVPKKVVVREGGANEPTAQIEPGMTPEEAARERRSAEQWLGTADGQLKQITGRTLDERQRETVAQIHNYIDGARSALKEGDLGRASTLAQKAQLLSDDLVKH